MPDLTFRFIQRSFYPTPAEVIISKLHKKAHNLHGRDSDNTFKAEDSRESKYNSNFINYNFLFILVLTNGGGGIQTFIRNNETTIQKQSNAIRFEVPSLTVKPLIKESVDKNSSIKKNSYKNNPRNNTKEYLVEDIARNTKYDEYSHDINYNPTTRKQNL